MLFCFRLEVKVEGKPKPTPKWIKQGVEIQEPSEGIIIENFEDGTSVLTITEVYPDDVGDIVFEAYNPLGVATTTTELSLEGIFSSFFPYAFRFVNICFAFTGIYFFKEFGLYYPTSLTLTLKLP